LLGINRTSYYYNASVQTQEEREREELIKSRIDYWHTKHCYFGARKLAMKLREVDGIKVGRKLTSRYMVEIGIYSVYPKPNLSKNSKAHPKFPYLLRNMEVFLPNQVWAVDLTYIKMGKSHMYLTAIIDWYSRYIVGWALSDTLEAAPVLEAVKAAVARYGVPAVINSDQGTQFTSDDYIGLLKTLKIRQSMDGKARWIDNVVIERWFRSLKCENIYITEYNSPRELKDGIEEYVDEYNNDRPHQSFDYLYPSQVYYSKFTA